MNAASPNAHRRIVCLAGPKGGVGKSTIALNLALAWAGTQARNVVIVHLDPLCRDDVSPRLGLEPPTLADLVWAGAKVSRGGLRPHVPLSQWGVGCLPLAGTPEEAARVFPQDARRELERLSASYDLFLDVSSASPLRRLALQMAGLTFWACLPHRAYLDASEAALAGERDEARPCEVVINQSDIPGGLPEPEVDAVLRRLRKPVWHRMPHEALIPAYDNQRKALVVEHPNSEWAKALRPILGRVCEMRR
jgi:pilus assembly protein CpaE